MQSSSRLGRLTSHSILILLSVIAVFPILWMVITAVKPESEIFNLTFWPQHLTFANFRTVWRSIPIGRMLLNTLAMAVVVTAVQVVTSVLAAYGFGRWKFRGSRLLYMLVVGTWLVPFQVTMIPNYVTVSNLGWLNTLAGLVVPHFATAMGIIMLTDYVRSFPTDLYAAASLDGAGPWGTLRHVLLPNLKAPISALSILLFISAWNEYFWPMIVTNKRETTVIQVGLQMFLSQEQGNQWGSLMAAATLASVPVLLIYMLFQRQVIDSFVRSGMK